MNYKLAGDGKFRIIEIKPTDDGKVIEVRGISLEKNPRPALLLPLNLDSARDLYVGQVIQINSVVITAD